MPAIIHLVDACVVAATLFDEPEAQQIATRMSGVQLVAPTLLEFELANVCVIKCRRLPDQRDRLLAAFNLRRQLAIRLVEVDHDEIARLADETGLTAYDAAYLWLAHSLGAELLTFDRKLERAASHSRR